MPARIEVTAGDGWRLAVRQFPAKGSGRGALLCGHAMMTDGAYFAREGGFAEHLAAGGFDVFVPDFRGHGASGPTASEGGRWSFDDLVNFDWPALRSAAAARAGCREDALAVLGHSLGGLVTVAHASRTRAAWARTALVAANFWRLPALRGFTERMRAAALVRVLDRFAAAGRVLPVRRLRAGNADEAPAYVRQFVSWTRTGEFRAQDGFDYESALGAWPGPLAVIAAEGDWMCTPAGARDFVRRAGEPVSVAVEGPTSGLPYAPDHFTLFTRSDARPFWDRLGRFLVDGKYD